MKLFLLYSLRHLRTRHVTTGLTVGGVALVVFVFTSVLMLAYGVEQTLVSTGSPDNVLILRKGAGTEIASGIYRDQATILKTLAEIAQDKTGLPLMATELVVLVNMKKNDDAVPGIVTLRGGSQESFLVRPHVTLMAGRMWRSGTSEVIVGKQIADRFEGAHLGGELKFGKQQWHVVGVFQANGSGFESEVWGDVTRFMETFGRTNFSSATMQLTSPELLSHVQTQLEQDPRLSLTATPERQYYEAKSGQLATFIRVLGLVLTGLFSIGAVLGAMITMYSSVATRSPEIATLRALGFTQWRILTVFFLESLLIGLVGGSVGLVGASLLQSTTISTMNFSTFSELAYGFTLSPTIALSGMSFALVMAALGGLFPAIQAMRTNVTQALKTRIA